MSGIDLRPLDVLKLGFWNINGLNSKVIGNKLTNQDFSLKMESCNIIGLAETHSHSLTLEKLSIPGFARKPVQSGIHTTKDVAQEGLLYFVGMIFPST